MNTRVRLIGLGALAVIVIAGAARPLHNEVTPSKAFVVLAIVLPAALVPALLVRFAEARRWLPLFALLIVGLAIASAAVAVLAGHVPVKPLHPRAAGSASQSGSNSTIKAAQAAHSTSTHFTISKTVALLLVLVLLLAVAAAIAIAARRRPAPAPAVPLRRFAPEPEHEEVARRFYSLLDDTLDDLRAEADPRRAVITAYARMERGLGTLGIERLVAETPFEYLARVLERLSVGEPAARALTDLFERAKFSPAPVGEEMKRAAVDALETIREEAREWAA